MSNRSAGISKKKLTTGTQKTKQMGKNAIAILTMGGGRFYGNKCNQSILLDSAVKKNCIKRLRGEVKVVK